MYNKQINKMICKNVKLAESNEIEYFDRVELKSGGATWNRTVKEGY